jgi:hypothetical protein
MTTPDRVTVHCPECNFEYQVDPVKLGKRAKCRSCGCTFNAGEKPEPKPADPRQPKPEPLSLPVEVEEESPRPGRAAYKESVVKNVAVYVLAIVGGLCLASGFSMDTTVGTEGRSVHNIGLLNEKLVAIMAGFGFLGLAAILRIVAIVEAVASLYKRRS